MRAKRKKVISLTAISLVVSLVVLLTGLTGQALPQKKVMLAFWQTVEHGRAPLAIMHKEMIEAFEKEHPDIHVSLVMMPFKGFYPKLMTVIEAGVAPDIFRLGAVEQTVPFDAIKGMLYLDDQFEKWEIKDDFYECGLEACRNLEGKLTGIPKDLDTRILYYRKDWLMEAGYLEPPKYWDELLEVAQKMTRDTDGDGKIDQWGIGIPGGKGWDCWIYGQQFIASNGGFILTPDSRRAAINSPEAQEGFQFAVDLLRKYKVAPPGTPTYMGRDVEKLFVHNKVGMLIEIGAWFLGVLEEEAPELVKEGRVGYAALPQVKGKPPVYFLGVHSVNINRETPHPDEAWEFVKFYLSDKWQYEYAAIRGEPARISTFDVGIFKTEPYRPYKEQMPYARGPQKTVHWLAITDILITRMQEALSGKITAKEACAVMEKEINELLKR